MDILAACDEPDLFAPWFRQRATWAAWRAFLAALFGLPMDDEALATYRKHTGRDVPPGEPSEEAWLVVGRRGGKSFVMALVAVYLAVFRTYDQHLAPGERATVLVLAADRRQARVILRYVRALLTQVPMLKVLVERETAEAFDLSNRVTIEVGSASFRSTRGYTFAGVLADEVAFWRTDDAAEPDFEILDAIRPGLATIPGAMLLAASSPYARRGALWDAFRRWHGKPNGPLVWRAASRDMNPTIRPETVERALEHDRLAAGAEWLAEFRSDLEAFVSREVVESAITPGVRERGRVAGMTYRAFVDPSGGSNDAMTLAIAHRQGDGAVLDALRERRPPFSPEAAVQEFAATLKAYGVQEVTGDRYGGEWPREAFRRHGVSYRTAELSRSELYRELLPALNSGRAELLDSPTLVAQLVRLERRTNRAGRESIDHPPGEHDDLANAAAGAVSMCISNYVTPPMVKRLRL